MKATYGVLEEILKINPKFVEILEHSFAGTTSENKKYAYALLIVDFKPIDPCKSYLINHHDWEESDFE